MSQRTASPDGRVVGPVPALAREDDRRRRLTVMRRWATGVLVAVSVCWIAMVVAAPSGDWAGYVRAALEASMVGALADWFAVTALFRRPLGLPIPHTAIVVERKQQFGQTLATFFRENFLSGAAVGERLRSSDAVLRGATWLADPDHATTLVRDLLRRADVAFDTSSDRVAGIVVEELRQIAAHVPVAEWSATLVRAAAANPRLDDVIDEGCRFGRRALLDHVDELEATFAGERPWWLPEAVQHRLFEHLVERVVDGLDAVARDPLHPARERVRTMLRDLARDLESDPELRGRLEALGSSLVDDADVHDTLRRVVGEAVERFRNDLRTPGGAVEQRLVALVTDAAARVRDDPQLHVRIERAAETAVDRAMTTFGGDVDALVTGTLSRWDATRTAEQLELLLGPDLQYIRINGAVVGGLAGLLLHAVAQTIG